jgi:hypothetical protein
MARRDYEIPLGDGRTAIVEMDEEDYAQMGMTIEDAIEEPPSPTSLFGPDDYSLTSPTPRESEPSTGNRLFNVLAQTVGRGVGRGAETIGGAGRYLQDALSELTSQRPPTLLESFRPDLYGKTAPIEQEPITPPASAEPSGLEQFGRSISERTKRNYPLREGSAYQTAADIGSSAAANIGLAGLTALTGNLPLALSAGAMPQAVDLYREYKKAGLPVEETLLAPLETQLRGTGLNLLTMGRGGAVKSGTKEAAANYLDEAMLQQDLLKHNLTTPEAAEQARTIAPIVGGAFGASGPLVRSIADTVSQARGVRDFEARRPEFELEVQQKLAETPGNTPETKVRNLQQNERIDNEISQTQQQLVQAVQPEEPATPRMQTVKGEDVVEGDAGLVVDRGPEQTPDTHTTITLPIRDEIEASRGKEVPFGGRNLQKLQEGTLDSADDVKAGLDEMIEVSSKVPAAGAESAQQRFVKATSGAAFPSTLARLFPRFKPVRDVGINEFRNKHLVLNKSTEILRPYLDLDEADTRQVNVVLEALKRDGRGNMLFSPETLRTLGLNEQQVAGAVAFKDFSDNALNLIEKTMLDRTESLSPEVRERAVLQIQEDIGNMRNEFYIPRRRFGDSVLTITDDDGNLVASTYFDMVGKPTRKGLVDKNVPPQVKNFINQMRKEAPDRKLKYELEIAPEEIRTSSKEMPLELIADLAERNEQFYKDLLREHPAFEGPVGLSDLLRQNIQLKNQAENLINPGGFRQSLVRAGDVPGYSTDFKRSISQYAYQLANWHSKGQAQKEFRAALQGIDDPKLKFEAEQYASDILSPPDRNPGLSNAIASYFLAASPKFVAQQVLQPIQTTLPLALQGNRYGGYRATVRKFGEALVKAGHWATNKKSFTKRNPELAKAINKEIASGKLSSAGLRELQGRGYAEGGKEHASTWKKYHDEAFSASDFADSFNRIHAFILDWDHNKKLEPEARRANAVSFADETQFDVTQADTPRIFRNKLAPLAVMRLFGGRMLRIYANALGENGFRKGVLPLMAAHTALGGVKALPLVAAFVKAAEIAGYEPEKALDEAAEEIGLPQGFNPRIGPTGEKISNPVVHLLKTGLVEYATGANVGPSLAVTPILPQSGENLFQQIGGFVAGPGGELIRRGERFSSLYGRNPEQATEWLLPEAARNLAAGLRWADQGVVRTSGGTEVLRDVQPEEFQTKMLGFNPTDVPQAYRALGEKYRARNKGRSPKGITTELANAFRSQRPEDFERVIQRVKDAEAEGDWKLSDKTIKKAWKDAELPLKREITAIARSERLPYILSRYGGTPVAAEILLNKNYHSLFSSEDLQMLYNETMKTIGGNYEEENEKR